MKIVTPDYYSEFHCVGGECPDNCCIGWEIDIDDTTFEKYTSFTGKLGDKLRNNIVISDDGSRCFKLTDNERCPFLNENNLCEIIIESGENSLCDICNDHPRFHNCFGDLRETGVGLSCIKAAETILNKQERMVLLSEITDQPPIELDYDKDFFDYLYKIRLSFIELLQNRNLSFSQRISDLLFTAEKIQSEIDNGNMAIDVSKDNLTSIANEHDLSLYINILNELSPLNDEWTDRVNQFTVDDIIMAKYSISEYEIVAEQLVTYYIFRHFLSSVYDYDILSRIKFAVFCTLLSFGFIEDKSNPKTFMDMICKSACLISKEIEYCSENIDMLLDYTYTEPMMSSVNLAMLF